MKRGPDVEKTAAKAFALLERLAAGRAAGVTELARALGLAKSNVHRLLGTLVGLGYARRAPGGAYAATLKLWQVGVGVLNRLDLKQAARPHLEELAARTDETVHLTVLDRGEVVYVDKIESSHPVREFTRIGDRAPVHCTASGKAMLALLGAAPGPGPLRAYTRHTIADPRRLALELARVRRQGYALNLGEYGAYVNGVAAAIADHRGAAAGAVVISGPAERLRPALLRGYVPLVTAAARAISAELGGAAPFRHPERRSSLD